MDNPFFQVNADGQPGTPVLERMGVVSYSGGADHVNGLPRVLGTVHERLNRAGEVTRTARATYVIGTTSVDDGDIEFRNFAWAMSQLWIGKKLRRFSWAPGQFLYMVPGSNFTVSRPPLLGIYPEGTAITYQPHLDIRYPNGSCGVWNLTQDDLFANDWHYAPDADPTLAR